MFLRICPYFPFNARVCVNQHERLARQLQDEGIFFRKPSNAFVQCSDPGRLQHLADGLSPADLEAPIQGWLRELVPFYASADPNRTSEHAYRLFDSQVEYCTNLIFKERVALDRMAERLLDLNRSIGRPDKLSTIFGYRITKAYRGGLKTQIADHHLGNPVIRSEYKDSSIKQYVRDHRLLRTETTSYNTRDLGVGKSIRHLPQLRRRHARHQRSLPRHPTRRAGNVHRSRPVGTLASTDHHPQRASDTGFEAGRSAPAGRHAGAHLLRPSRARRPFSDP